MAFRDSSSYLAGSSIFVILLILRRLPGFVGLNGQVCIPLYGWPCFFDRYFSLVIGSAESRRGRPESDVLVTLKPKSQVVPSFLLLRGSLFLTVVLPGFLHLHVLPLLLAWD